MRVGIVGAGRIGGNVGIQLARSGHEVLFSYSRDPGKLERLAAGASGARAGAPREAVEFAEAVVFAVPWRLIDDVLGQMGSLDGKVVVDTTNQFGARGVEELPGGLSAVETNAQRMPGALLAKAFNTLTAGYQRDVAEAASTARWRCSTPPRSRRRSTRPPPWSRAAASCPFTSAAGSGSG